MKALLSFLCLGMCACGPQLPSTEPSTGGDPRQGLVAFQRYGCGACHQVSGVPYAHGLAGPSLDGLSSRTYVGGNLQNTPDNLEAWIMHPQRIDAKSAMPELEVSAADARDIAAFLLQVNQ